MKLAEALLRRKELQDKVEMLKVIKEADLFEVKYNRRKISEEYDDVTAKVPKLTASQVTEEYDYYASRLRLIDAAIQQCNWTVDITVNDRVWEDYTKS